MRLLPLVLVIALAGCTGSGSVTWPEQSAGLPSTGNDAMRDGFYDGGVYDPDLTRRDLPVAE